MDSREIDKRTQMMIELINCDYQVYYTIYDPDLTLRSTTCPPDLTMPNSILQQLLKSSVMRYINSEKRLPVFLDASINITWIIEGEYNDDRMVRLHALGPIFYQKVSSHYMLNQLDEHNLSVPLRSRILKQMKQIPVVPSVVFNAYGPQLHYCLTGEHITRDQVTFLTITADGETRKTPDYTDFSTEHTGVWASEQNFIKAFREGNPDYGKYLAASGSLSTGVKMQTGEPLRRNKNNVITLLTLISRAAIEGGLNPSISYTLNDKYMDGIEDCSTQEELADLTTVMTKDFIQRVQRSRSAGPRGLSRQIQNCCDYINMHLAEDLSIADLAGKFGYTEYYFSHKFKKEMGIPVRDYIKKQKLEQAKIMLSTTNESIQTICDNLNFGSRSFFSVAFKKAFDISPSEYRTKNSKI